MIKLTKPLAVIDIESTGVDTQKDRIITFANLLIKPDAVIDDYEITVNPGIEIPAEATEVHGITNEMVADKKPFSHYAQQIVNDLKDCDLCGFNLLNFDVPLLWEEFYRCGIEWDLAKTSIVDAGNIFKIKEPRDLSAAVKFYCGREHTGAHGAKADVWATRAVLMGQLDRYTDLPGTIGELAKFSHMDNRVDLAGVIVRNSKGEYCYTHKRVRGVKVKDDPGYANWLLRSDFSAQTKQVVQRILDELFPRSKTPFD